MAVTQSCEVDLPRKRTYLTQYSQTVNLATLKRLDRVMQDHGLNKLQVADLLGVSRMLVTLWFQHKRRCPDRTPETIKSIMVCRSRPEVEADLLIKRQARNAARRRKE